MTDAPFADPPAADNLEPELVAEEGNRRAMIAVGAVVAALVVLGGGYLLFGRGGSATPAALPVVHHVTRVVPGLPGAASPVPAAQIPGVFVGAIGRDPFKPLYVAPVAVAANPAPATLPVVAPVTPTGGSTGSTSGGSTSGSTGGTTQPAARTYPLKLVRVDQSSSGVPTAVFLVNGATVDAMLGTGKTPATIFGVNKEIQLVGLTEEDAGRWSATIEVGESRTDAQQGVTIFVV